MCRGRAAIKGEEGVVSASKKKQQQQKKTEENGINLFCD